MLSIYIIKNCEVKMEQQRLQPHIQSLAKSLLKNDSFINQIKFLIGSQVSKDIRSKKQKQLNAIIQQISELLTQLIRQKLQNEMNQLIQQNNRILIQIRQSLLKQSGQLPVQSIIKQQSDISFSDVHKLINQEKRKFQNENGFGNDAELEKSISSLVEFKFQSLEEKVLHVDKRLKMMEDKYESNLKSIWNVLSMTEQAVFDHLKSYKQKEKTKDKKNQQPQTSKQKKSSFNYKFW